MSSGPHAARVFRPSVPGCLPVAWRLVIVVDAVAEVLPVISGELIEIRNGRPRLRLHNETAHLASLAQETAEARERARSGAL